MSLAQMIRRVAGGKGPRMSGEETPDMEEDDKETAEDEQPEAGDDVENDAPTEDDHPEDESETEENDTEQDMPAAEKKAFAKGRAAERSRISSILGSPKAEANPALAAHLAFKTSDSARKALATLEHGSAAASGGTLSGRMNARGQSRTGRGGESDVRTKNAGSSWDGALARAGKLKGN